jgi:ribosomal protein S18 acetylase RimI-like enzyme
MSLKCVETKKIQNPELFANIIYNNFLYLTEFPHLSHNKKTIIDTLRLPNNLCFLVYNDDKLIGYLVGDFKTLNDQRYVYYISYLYVLESYRSNGLGGQLMNLLINRCKSLGVSFIVLTCDNHDPKVIKFYKKHGFVLDPILGLKASKRHQVMCLYL